MKTYLELKITWRQEVYLVNRKRDKSLRSMQDNLCYVRYGKKAQVNSKRTVING